MIGAVGRPQIEKLIEIIEDSRFSKHRRRNHAEPGISDHQAVRPSGSIDMICGLSASTAGHILAHDIRVSRRIFLQEWDHCSYPHVSRTARVPTLDDGNGLSFEKIRV